MKASRKLAAVFVLVAGPAFAPFAQAAQSDPGRTYQVADNLYVAVLEDRNTPFVVGDDAVLLVETNFARNAQSLMDLIGNVSGHPVRLVVNSHWHGDHVGGNAFFAGNGAVTLAHANTRRQMGQQQVNGATGAVFQEAFGPEFLPMLTFTNDMMVHFGGEEISLVYHPDAHTDSDVVLHFRNANVIYMGGLLNYPTYAGVHSPVGFVAALDQVLAQADENTQIIPWRGPVVGKNEVQEWRNLLATVSARVTALIAEGKTAEEIVAAQPSREFDAKWGGARTPERFALDMHYALINPPN